MVDPPVLPVPRTVRPLDGDRDVRDVQVRVDADLGRQCYRLVVRDDVAELVAGDEAGLTYGRQTLRQLTRDDGRVACVEVDDGPDLLVRGVMLDVSRDKVPTMATLRDLVERLASWRVNHLQLYIEHTYAYEGFQEVWEGWSPFTADEVTTLERWCAAHHIELVVQQNCLGHLERWLCHPRFAPLAAIPGGWHDDAGHAEPATTLDPRKPGSWELVTELLRQQRALRPSAGRLHVGLDEPLDLNPAIWERVYAPEVYTEDGTAEVFSVPLPDEAQQLYVDWLRRLRSWPGLDGVELLVWGDVVAENPAVRDAVPAGVTIVEWGYERYHPFDERCRALAAAGLPFWVCAGSSAWNSLGGRPTNARQNIDRAVGAAVAHGGAGLLVADWGDRGHSQQLAVVEPAFAYGAMRGWRSEPGTDPGTAASTAAGTAASTAAGTGARAEWDAITARAVFADDATGQLVTRLGDSYLRLRPQVPEASVLVTLLAEPGQYSALRGAGLDLAGLAAVRDELVELSDLLPTCRPDRADSAVVRAELEHTLQWLHYAVDLARHRLARLDGEIAPAEQAELRSRYVSLVADYRERWLARNRPGGLEDSVRQLAAADPECEVS